MTTNTTPNASELANELNKLGDNLANLLKAAWESEERRSVEREIASGIEQMNKKLADAAEQIRTDARLNEAKRAAKEAWETAHGPQVVNELRLGVLDTLKRINEELIRRAAAAPAHEASAAKAAGPVEATVVEVQDKPE